MLITRYKGPLFGPPCSIDHSVAAPRLLNVIMCTTWLSEMR